MIKKLAACVGEYKKFAIATPFIMLGEAVMDIVLPLIMANMIDYGIQAKDMGYTIRMGLLMILCTLFALICGAGGGITAAHAATGFAKNLRAKLFKKVQTFSFSNIDRFSTASLVTRLTTDVTNTQNAFQMLIRMAVRSPVMLIGAAIMAIRINPELSAIFLVVIPILGISLFLIMSKAHPRFEAMMEKYDALNNSVQENLSAIRVVKAFVREDYEDKKFKNSADNVRRAQLFAEKLVILNSPIMQLCMYGCILAVLWFGGNMVLSAQLQVGDLTGFLSYVFQVMNSMMMISNVFLLLTRSLASARRISEVLQEEVELASPQDAVRVIPDGSVDFENVSFQYSSKAQESALSNVTLHIKAGQTVGILGGTGSAKSSLVQLIPRLYDVSEGSVRVGGQDVRAYDLQALRDAVGIVLQKNVLFSGTVRENLKWGDPDASDETLWAACRAACADEFLQRMPKGLDTDLGQGGVNVSGGQKQRLCIARTLLKNPKILIFDDSTSAVDTATEAKIRAELAKLTDVTKIIIAQRVTSVMDSDQIVIMENGRIHAVGTHDELLAGDPIYQEIYHSQMKGGQLHGQTA